MSEARRMGFFDILPDHYLRLLHIDNRELADLDPHCLLRLDHLSTLSAHHLLKTTPATGN